MFRCNMCKHPGVHAEVVAHDQPRYCSQCPQCNAEKRLAEKANQK